jgi:hypothetical protein
MQGIAAISANNGWAMALAGACIVMTGLAVLAFVISQLHKIIFLLEGKGRNSAAAAQQNLAVSEERPAAPPDLLSDPAEAARFYRSLSLGLGETFSIASLYLIFKEENQPHPHITIRTLREGGFLVLVEDGKFGWNNI